MNRIEYSSGAWSERDGSLLTWGRGDKSLKERFGTDTKITELSYQQRGFAKKAGMDPSLFCSAGGVILGKNFIPEIEACIAHARAAEKAKTDAEKVVFDIAVKSGKAFRTAEIADQYDAELHWARRLREDEKAEYADWFRDLCMVGFPGSARIVVEREAINQVVGDRVADGQFNGCSNSAWTISADEWDKIIALSADIKASKEKNHHTFEAEEAADIQSKIRSGYCFNCETWCDGDCGHYSNDPTIKYRRDLDQTEREANYGIND